MAPEKRKTAQLRRHNERGTSTRILATNMRQATKTDQVSQRITREQKPTKERETYCGISEESDEAAKAKKDFGTSVTARTT
jgi:hypothetical protein